MKNTAARRYTHGPKEALRREGATPKWRSACLIALSAALMSAGCKSIHTAPANFDFKATPDVGLAIISTRIDSRCNTVVAGAAIEYRSEVDGSIGVILMDNSFVQRDFEDPPGYLFAKPLKPGMYVLGKLTIPNRRAVHPLGLDFTVQQGRATYLGEFSIQVPDCTSFRYSVANQWERDAAMIRNKYPNVRIEDVDVHVMRNSLMPTRLP
jgi:hypothetical protein